jgi:hypothetical protein
VELVTWRFNSPNELRACSRLRLVNHRVARFLWVARALPARSYLIRPACFQTVTGTLEARLPRAARSLARLGKFALLPVALPASKSVHVTVPVHTGAVHVTSAVTCPREEQRAMDARNQQQNTSNFHDFDALRGQTVTQLKAKYRELFGDESRSNHKQFLVRRVAWRYRCQGRNDRKPPGRRKRGPLRLRGSAAAGEGEARPRSFLFLRQ